MFAGSPIFKVVRQVDRCGPQIRVARAATELATVSLIFFEHSKLKTISLDLLSSTGPPLNGQALPLTARLSELSRITAIYPVLAAGLPIRSRSNIPAINLLIALLIFLTRE